MNRCHHRRGRDAASAVMQLRCPPGAAGAHHGPNGSMREGENSAIPPGGSPQPAKAAARRPRRRDARQVSRRAVVIGSRAARNAGNRPPTRPMPSAHFSPLHSSSGETWNLNTTALKLLPMVDTL